MAHIRQKIKFLFKISQKNYKQTLLHIHIYIVNVYNWVISISNDGNNVVKRPSTWLQLSAAISTVKIKSYVYLLWIHCWLVIAKVDGNSKYAYKRAYTIYLRYYLHKKYIRFCYKFWRRIYLEIPLFYENVLKQELKHRILGQLWNVYKSSPSRLKWSNRS